jgi:hypothetical protein
MGWCVRQPLRQMQARDEGILFGVAPDGDESRRSQVRFRLKNWGMGDYTQLEGAGRVCHPEAPCDDDIGSHSIHLQVRMLGHFRLHANGMASRDRVSMIRIRPVGALFAVRRVWRHE